MASRVRSPIASRSHWLTETMILRTSLPEAEPVSSDSATDTNETPRRWNCSSRTAKSLTDRVSRSSLATITLPTARDWTISRMRTMPGRSRSLALSPASTITSSSSTSWTVAMALIFSTCASSETPRSACLSVETRTYPIPFVVIFLKKLDHTSGGSHKLSGYLHRSCSGFRNRLKDSQNYRLTRLSSAGEPPAPRSLYNSLLYACPVTGCCCDLFAGRRTRVPDPSETRSAQCAGGWSFDCGRIPESARRAALSGDMGTSDAADLRYGR